MNSLVIDMTHGGVKIAVSLAKKDETVYAYDIYNTLKSVDKKMLAVYPVHLPLTKRDIEKYNPSLNYTFLTHHEIIKELLKNWGNDIPKIEVTGVKGKTSCVFMLKEILIDKNPLILSSLGALLYENGVKKTLKQNISITPANIKETIDLAYKIANPVCEIAAGKCDSQNLKKYGCAIFESSLGASGIGDVGLLTNIVENYPIAKNKRTASEAKSQIFNCSIVAIQKETLDEFYKNIEHKKINTFSLNNNADELKVQLADYAKAVKDLEEALAIDASRKRVQELEHTMSRPGFYDDADLSKKVFDEVGDLKGKLSRFEKLQGLYDDAETMLEMLDEEYDPAMIPEAEEAVNTVGKAVEELQLMTMLNGEYDHSNAILTFHAGTGGTEAQDWAEMLYRMYNKWAQAHGMTVEVLDYQDGDEAGMKSASMMVKGANAYGLLKSENGVHRLVRVSPFDDNARRQTSFASLEVMPELDNTIQVDIRPEDIEMQVYRSSGAGGQHINKTSSAVRLIHKPTGVVVSCQTQRSQFQNRDYAMEMLKAKLYQIAKQQHMDKIDDIKGVQNEIAWGHQIRSYVFMPYTMVKDHRTNYETGNVDAVMDGDLDGFIFAYLKAASRGELQDA